MRTVLVPISQGFEEIETSSIIDVLRRGGLSVSVAGVDGSAPCTGAHGMRIVPDQSLEDAKGPWDLIVLPGGFENSVNLSKNARVQDLLRTQVASGALTAAICAAPMALDAAGILPEGQYTCYPGVDSRLRTPGRLDNALVDTPQVVTSQGPATSIAFALHLVGRLVGEAKQKQVASDLLYR